MIRTRRRLCQGIAVAVAQPALALAGEGDISVGQIGPFTGIPVPDALQLNQGIKACFAQINERGGINGRRVSFFDVDDTYSADGFAKAFAQAMQRKPVALLDPVGSAALKRLLDDKMLDQSDVIVLNAIPGAEALRNPGHPKLFHIRAGDRQQIEKIVQHAVTLGVTELAVLHHNIVIGTSGLAMAQAAANATGKLKVLPFEATAEIPSIAAAAKNVAKSGVKAVLVVGAPRFMADGVAQLRTAGGGQFVFALSYVPAGAGRQGGRRGLTRRRAVADLSEPDGRGIAAAARVPGGDEAVIRRRHAIHLVPPRGLHQRPRLRRGRTPSQGGDARQRGPLAARDG
jgi:ABC-type branched-subunit amino acid transport system substrate-binding protein